MNTEPKEIQAPRSYDEVVAYIRSLKVGERVMETERSSALFGRCGTVYIGHQDSICVRWDIRHGEDGSMGSSCTEGARRVTELSEANAKVAEPHDASRTWHDKAIMGLNSENESLRAQLSTLQAALALSEAKIAEKDAALKAAKRLTQDNYTDWTHAGGPDECEHGHAKGIACARCDEATLDAALATTGQEWAERMKRAEEMYALVTTSLMEAFDLKCLQVQAVRFAGDKYNAALSRCREMEEAMRRALAVPGFKYVSGSKFISDALSAPAVEKADPQPHKEPEIHTRFEP